MQSKIDVSFSSYIDPCDQLFSLQMIKEKLLCFSHVECVLAHLTKRPCSFSFVMQITLSGGKKIYLRSSLIDFNKEFHVLIDQVSSQLRQGKVWMH